MVAACPFPTSQGSQVLIRQLSETLHERGHELHLVTYHYGEPANEPMHFHIHRILGFIPYRKLRAGPSFRKPLLDLLLAIELMRVVRRYRIQIIHAHNYEGLAVGISVRSICGVRIVYHSHNAMIDELHTYFRSAAAQRVANRLAAVLDRNLPRTADHCIALNNELVEYFQRTGVRRERIGRLPPGTFVQEFQPPRLPESVRQQKSSQPTVIYTGNLDAYQNLEILFAAMTIVSKHIPTARLLMVSHAAPGPVARLVRSFDLADQVRFITTNSFTEVVNLLADSDVAVIPRTNWSGFPIKLINYMAAGKAILASEGSAKHMVHLENGYIVPNFNVPAMAHGLVQLLREPALRERLGAAAARTARESHNWHILCSELESIYSQVLSPRP